MNDPLQRLLMLAEERDDSQLLLSRKGDWLVFVKVGDRQALCVNESLATACETVLGEIER